MLIAAALLCGCNPTDNAMGASRAKASATYASIPLDKSDGILNGYSVRVPREGDILWNGQPVGTAALNDYLQQFARLPASAGRLFIAFEPGVAQHRAQQVRHQVVASGLCDQHRCAKVGWGVKRPLVN
ncbi:hypothetical protein [Sphingomonas sp. NPDC079357]|uniref:hypothetical protein n=1 Tax=Sphingomonas sp. NPDC079357 TaxID=3364518 RepID=UPI00384C57A4